MDVFFVASRISPWTITESVFSNLFSTGSDLEDEYQRPQTLFSLTDLSVHDDSPAGRIFR